MQRIKQHSLSVSSKPSVALEFRDLGSEYNEKSPKTIKGVALGLFILLLLSPPPPPPPHTHTSVEPGKGHPLENYDSWLLEPGA